MRISLLYVRCTSNIFCQKNGNVSNLNVVLSIIAQNRKVEILKISGTHLQEHKILESFQVQ